MFWPVIHLTLALLMPAASTATVTETRALVYASEYRLNVSRASVRSGVLIAEVRNIGEDHHDLVIRSGAQRVAGIPPIRPGRSGRLRVTLRPGRYTVVCTVADHERRGMRRTLRVTP